MATNPMKRREHNAFLIGFIIALVIMAVVVMFIFKMYSEKKDELENLKAQQVEVLVAANSIESGAPVTEDDFTTAIVMTEMSSEDYLTSSSDILVEPIETEEETEEGEEGEEAYAVEMVAKIAIPAGTIVTPNMFVESGEELTDDARIQEYSSILLPSQLKNGDFVDIRFTLPSGQDYIVLSKKEVIQTDETTVWLQVNESELLQLNSAMVEAWTITGTKLYAIEYVEAGMQQKSKITYKPSAEVMDLINANPNVVQTAYNELANGLNATRKEGEKVIDQYREYIDSTLEEYREDRDSAVESGFTEETTSIQTHRAEYVESLEGSGLIGNPDVSTSDE